MHRKDGNDSRVLHAQNLPPLPCMQQHALHATFAATMLCYASSTLLDIMNKGCILYIVVQIDSSFTTT